MGTCTRNECNFSAQEETWSKTSIYRIPLSITSLKEARVYQPQMVSIGPYHHGKQNLKAMQIHKHRAQCKFLERCGEHLGTLCHKLWPRLQDLKNAYDEWDDDPETGWKGTDEDSFLTMMVLDGCFILELLRTTGPGRLKDQTLAHDDYPQSEQIFSNHGKLNFVPYLKRDMLMLENQIPMLVLELLDSVDPLQQRQSGFCQQKQRVSLTKRILEFYSQPTDSLPEGCSHILDLYRKSLIFEPKVIHSKTKRNDAGNQIRSSKMNSLSDAGQIIRSATELNDSGIKIRRSKTNSLKDITFRRRWLRYHNAVLRLPRMMVDHAFESTYLNLIAYELLRPGMGNNVITYVFLMDNLIDSIQDVNLLRSGEVIDHALGSEEAVAKLFNSLLAKSILDPLGHLHEVHGKVNKYYKKRRHQWRAYCCHSYFPNPWVAITVLAAIFLFITTTLQTVFSVLSYYKSSS